MKKLSPITILTIICLIFLLACKEADELGVQVQPDADKAKTYFDTSVVFNSISQIDSVMETKMTTINTIGEIYDYHFGRTTAGFATQFKLKSSVSSLSPYSIDSLVLKFKYSGYYGDANTNLKIKVYRLQDDLLSDNNYYAYSKPTLTENNFIQEFDISASDLSANDSLLLTIKNQNFLNNFMSNLDNFTDNTKFLDFFKGLYLITEGNGIANPAVNSVNGTMLFFTLNNSNSGMTLYYQTKKENSDTIDKAMFEFEINSSCVRYNTFDHYSYNDAQDDLKQQIFNNNFVSGNNKAYLQSMGGISVKVNSLNLTHIFNDSKKYSIHKAELVVNIDEVMQGDKPNSPRLRVFKQDGSAIIDILEGDAYIDGYYNSINKQYRINVTRHLQSLIKNQEECSLIIYNNERAINANSLIIKGGEGIRLHVLYTEL